MDNFAWAKGYTQHFGIVRTDYTTQPRYGTRWSLATTGGQTAKDKWRLAVYAASHPVMSLD